MDKKALSDITVFNKYARFTKTKNRRENWNEIVMRNALMHKEKYPWMTKDIDDIYNKFVYTKKVLPSMRSLQFGGRPILMAENRIFNCAYAPAESTKFFSELMFLLLGGTGMGYSVQRRHIDKLPKIKTPESDEEYKYQVQDSIVGWSDAVKVVCKAFFNAGTLPIFDYRDIREKGAELITTGGQAPGPEPLRICVTQLTELLRSAVGRKLEPIEVHDMACIIADAVLAGGIRRAAMISLFDLDDEAMLTCKSGEWWKDHPARARANNSAVLLRGAVSEVQFYELMNRIEDSGCGEPGIYWTNNKDWGTNPSLRKGTKVLTTEGILPIERLQDKEFYVKNLTGEISKAKCWLSGKGKKLYELKLSTGKSYFATAEHEWPVVVNGKIIKVRTPDLQPKNRLPIIKETSLFDGYVGTAAEGFFIGMLLGDGWITERGDTGARQTGLVVSKAEPELKEKIERFFSEIGVNAKLNIRNNGTYEVNTCNKVLDEIIDRFEFDFTKQSIPSVIFTKATEATRKGFIDGIFSSDGHVEKGKRRITLTSSRKGLLEDVAEILGFYGIRSTIISSTTSIKGYSKVYHRYDLRISDATSISHFRKCFSLSNIAKQAQLDAYDCSIKTKPKDYVEVLSVEATDLYEDVWDVSVFDTTHCFQISHCITGNCCEIALRPYQMCNLTEINAGAIHTQREFNEAASAASFIGTLQAGYTDFHYLNPKWRLACEKEALLGVSMTGIASGTVALLDMGWASQCVVDTNIEIAAKLGINTAARSTCVKPAGTTSLVLGTSSGIHAWHAPYYIRRMRAGKDEALAQYMMKAAPGLVEQDVTKPNQVVLSFPQKAPEGAVTRNESMMSLLERVKNVSIKWVANGHTSGTNQHNVSCTISVKPDEWEELAIWMWENRAHYNGISVLPFFGAEAYPQLPFEDITKEQYNAMLPLLKGIDISKVFEEDGSSVDLAAELACAGGACEVSF